MYLAQRQIKIPLPDKVVKTQPWLPA